MVMELVDPDGIVLRRDVIAAGYDDKALRRQVVGGTLRRIRQGAYCLAPLWASSTQEQRHLLTVKAVCRQYDDDVAVSHASAVLWWGAPLVGVQHQAVHLTHLDGEADRHQAGIVHHRGTCLVSDVSRAADHWVTSPTRTALDSCLTLPRRSALCVLDWFLHEGLTTTDELRQRAIGMGTWPGSLPMMHLLGLTDPRAESPGETLTRLLIHESDLPDPVSQLDISGTDGRWLARVDFAWPDKMALLEFDGLRKLTSDLRDGETALDAVVREKRREDRLREAGWLVIRITWDDVLRHPARTIQRIRAFLAMADARPAAG